MRQRSRYGSYEGTVEKDWRLPPGVLNDRARLLYVPHTGDENHPTQSGSCATGLYEHLSIELGCFQCSDSLGEGPPASNI